MRRHPKIWLMAVVTATLLLAACGRSELYSGLSEREVNEMAAAMKNSGLDASKGTKDSKTWTLSTRSDEFAEAVALLQARGYPHDHFDSLGDVFKKQGFVSSPLEERARMNYGLSQELSNTLSNIDGVVSARVHLSIPDNDPLSESQKPSSASVLIRYDPQVDISSQVGPIKALVVNSIEGLTYDRVTVVLSPARILPPPHRAAAQASLFVPFLVAIGAALVSLGGLWLSRGRTVTIGAGRP